ncbi:SGNH/GDSL hydrolase family protein [Amycolatopsis rubida]|uniref:Lysophospholipase L1 n=1 Tax=Amycolatopsis rubida TaxID=112413 RepID=A0A1I5DDG3_9PSEU|nr:SGNH/GDSL hydrolase family protein [Amycolatopsis rubida]SFN97243.1 Lysophospholipase L1 [Amycolatopsis rubida]
MENHWIAAWGTAQQLATAAESGGGPEMPDEAPPDFGTTPETVSAQTVRMVARSTVGGTAVRVALSNSFGHPPVRIGAAFLDGTQLTFSDRPEVVLPTGAQIYSDPVEYPVSPQTDLAVSLYLPGEKVTPTVHEVGLRTAWLAPGDQTASTDLRDATEFQSYLWLTGIDVFAPRTAATVIAFGDSLVDGMETTPGTDAPWTSVLARRFASDFPPRAVVNMGISGNRVLRESDGMGTSALARFDRDVLARPGARWIILSVGGNDLIFGSLPGMPDSEQATAADLVDGYRLLLTRARLHGLRVVGCTLPPIGGSPVFTQEFEDARQQVNRWIRDSGEFDAVTDLDAALRDPAEPTKMRAGLVSADGVHPTDAGHAAIAESFDLELFRHA